MTFRAAGRATVEARFPSLRPWLEATLGEPGARALTPFWRRRVERVPNAWYLNVLLMNSGASVARHLDVTLRGPSGDDEGAPELVSVLYLKVPRAPGGDLCLWAGPEPVAVVHPRENRAVHFRGDLAHEVRPFDSPDPAELRASLVIEQYHFAPDALERLPDFQLDSRAGFDAFLEAHRSRGAGTTPAFELEK